MYNSIVSLKDKICKEVHSLCNSDINDLKFILNKEYIKERQVSITITQEEYAAYVNSKNREIL